MKMNTRSVGLLLGFIFLVLGLFCFYMGNQAKKKIAEINLQTEQLEMEIQVLDELIKLDKERDIICEKIDAVFDELERTEYHTKYKNDSATWEKVKKMLVLFEGYIVELENVVSKTEKIISNENFGLSEELKKEKLQYIEDTRQDIAIVRILIKALREDREKNEEK